MSGNLTASCIEVVTLAVISVRAVPAKAGAFLRTELLGAWAFEQLVGRRQLACAQLFDRNGYGAGHIAHLCLNIFVGIKRVVAGGIGLVVADEPVQPGLGACVDKSHPVEPVA